MVSATANIAMPATSTMKGAEKPAKRAMSGATESAPSRGPIASTDMASASQKPMVPRASWVDWDAVAAWVVACMCPLPPLAVSLPGWERLEEIPVHGHPRGHQWIDNLADLRIPLDCHKHVGLVAAETLLFN